MWGKKRNRRQSRYRLLEVDLPVGKVRRQRMKAIVRWAGGLLGLAALFFGVWHGGARNHRARWGYAGYQLRN